jgi:hypothetical protein
LISKCNTHPNNNNSINKHHPASLVEVVVAVSLVSSLLSAVAAFVKRDAKPVPTALSAAKAAVKTPNNRAGSQTEMTKNPENTPKNGLGGTRLMMDGDGL